MALSAVLVSLAPPHLVVGALSLATTIAMLVVAVPMVYATRRLRGEAAVRGIGRAAIASLAAAVAGATAGAAATLAFPAGGKLLDAVSGAVAAAAAVVAFGVVAYVLDKDDLRTAAQRLRRLAKLRP
jgi:putative peptidoglycan lipid II flippase